MGYFGLEYLGNSVLLILGGLGMVIGGLRVWTFLCKVARILKILTFLEVSPMYNERLKMRRQFRIEIRGKEGKWRNIFLIGLDINKRK